jgi:transcriptional regulator with XRE-family HTH domain
MRLQAGTTQAEAASRAGVRQGLLSEIESGVANPTLSTLGAVARALGGRLDAG